MSGILWKGEVDERDYVAAFQYLSIQLDEERANLAHHKFMRAKLVSRRVNDLLRATGRPALDLHDPGVHKNMVAAVDGKARSPLLVVSFDRGCDVADGFHRLCFAYWYDPYAEVPLKLVSV